MRGTHFTEHKNNEKILEGLKLEPVARNEEEIA
jgi:hypothetical protein